MEKISRTIIRYNLPTKYDQVPCGCLCKSLRDIEVEEWDTHHSKSVNLQNTSFDLYIQTSKNKNNPEWKPIGEFFKVVFGDALYEEDVLDELVKLYQDDHYNSFLALSNLLKKKTKLLQNIT